jgi:hypothetical protein
LDRGFLGRVGRGQVEDIVDVTERGIMGRLLLFERGLERVEECLRGLEVERVLLLIEEIVEELGSDGGNVLGASVPVGEVDIVGEEVGGVGLETGVLVGVLVEVDVVGSSVLDSLETAEEIGGFEFHRVVGHHSV